MGFSISINNMGWGKILRSYKFWLLSILLLALFLRVVGLTKVPPELFGDELDVGYQSYSLLTTGRDYYGQFLPTYIHSLAEWRAPLLMYVTAPFVGVFGLNEYGIRLPEAFLGVLTIYVLYLFVDYEFKDKKLALLSAFLLTISPWHLQYSRAAFEVSLLLALVMGGAYLFVRSFKKRYYIYISFFLFGLTVFTYNTANVFTPLFIILLTTVYWKEVRNKVELRSFIKAFILLVIVGLPIVYSVLFGDAADRYRHFSVFADEAVVRQVIQKRMESGNTLMSKLLYNRPLGWMTETVSHYATAFSPQFLFISGDVTFRQSIHDVGEFYWFMLPLVIYGIYKLVKLKDKKKYFWLGWLFIGPLPSALTVDGAIHATRLILMLIPMIFISAYGLLGIYDFVRKIKYRKLIYVAFAVVVVFQITVYMHDYWVTYPVESWRWWATGYKQTMLYMKSQESSYKTLVFNNTYEPSLIRFLVWWKYPPSKFLKVFTLDQPKHNILPGLDAFKLGDKYYFGTAKDGPGGIPGFIKPGILYMVSQRDEVGGDWDWSKNPPGGVKVLKTVRNAYGDPIFYVITGV